METQTIHNVPTITVGQIPGIIKSAYVSDADCQTTISLEGEPGIGKTAIPPQVAEELGIGCVLVSAPLLDPATSAGVPVTDIDTLILQWATDARWPRVETHGERGILLIDEFPQCLPMVQAALSGLIWGRRMGSYTLPDGWMIVTTGNLKSHRAATHSTPQHIKGRLERYNVVSDFASFKNYWVKTNKNDIVLAYLENRTDQLSTFDPNAELYASPRGWEKVGSVMDADVDPDVRNVRIQATIGKAEAEGFDNFVNSMTKLPRLQEIVKDPSRARTVDDPGDQFLLLASLASAGPADKAAELVAYVQRYKPEMQATFVQYAEQKNRALFLTAELTKLKQETLGE